MSLTLVIGGTRSGKSARAESLALAAGGPVRYVATAPGDDAAMARRIARHRERRPADWETIEAGDALAETIAPHALSLIDGLGVWIAGVLHRGKADVATEVDRVIARARECDVIVVAEEAGQGLLPGDRASRDWLDALGEALQQFAAAAGHVELVVAGCPVPLRGPGASAGESGLSGRWGPAVAATGGTAPAADATLRHHGDRDVRPGDRDHAVNVLAGGPPPWLAAALSEALEDAAERYPDEDRARALTAARHGRAPAEVVLTNGGAEALWLLGPALAPRLAACVHPGFTEAEAGLRAHGIPVVRVLRDPDAGFALDPAAVPAAADLVIVNNPASPSGTLDPAAAILALRAPGRVVVVDEAFLEMVPGEPGSLAGEPLEDVIVIRSLTKLLSVPGLRAGYALAPPRLAAALAAVRPPWSVNALALAALAAAAEHPAQVAQLAERSAAEGADLAQRLSALDGVRVWPSVTNFSLIEVADGPGLVAALRVRGIAVRPAASFPGLGAGHVRVTARDPEANARLVAALADALAHAGAPA